MEQPKTAAQPRDKRVRNFNEVSLGYSKRQVLDEARRCPQCANPTCMEGCPLGIDIPGFIRILREHEPVRALAKIKEQNLFASICGRLCPAPCEKACVFYDDGAPIGIRALERYSADFGVQKISKLSVNPQAKKVAIIGSGPSGLTAAAYLRQLGYNVTLFEGLNEPGGILRYGVPEFRFPKKILNAEIQMLTILGVEIQTNFLVGRSSTLEELFQDGYSCILLALGAGTPRFLDVPGIHSAGVLYAEEFLMRVNLFKAHESKSSEFSIGQKAIVVGASHAALDCARTILRLGRDVTVVLQQTEDALQVIPQEKDYAKEEGIKLEPLVQIKEILSHENHFVRGLKCSRLDFADPGQTGQWQVIEVPNSEFILEADTVIIAVGHQPYSLIIKQTPELKLNSDGTIWTNEQDRMTSLEGIFACGNISRQKNSVVHAMAEGKSAAYSIDQYLKTKNAVQNAVLEKERT